MKNQERREKFVLLAENRVNRTIKQLRLIGNLANKGNYHYSEQDVNLIISTLNEEVKALKVRFQTQGRGSEPAFSLRGGRDRQATVKDS